MVASQLFPLELCAGPIRKKNKENMLHLSARESSRPAALPYCGKQGNECGYSWLVQRHGKSES
jgi:hypothetical protein